MHSPSYQSQMALAIFGDRLVSNYFCYDRPCQHRVTIEVVSSPSAMK
jgi:hypothetical protein